MTEITIVEDDTEIAVMEFDQSAFALLPDTIQGVAQAIAGYKNACANAAYYIWWLRDNDHYRRLRPDLNWVDFCAKELKCSRARADQLTVFVEVNRDLAPHIQCRVERHARLVAKIPRDHRVPVLEEAHRSCPVNKFNGFRMFSEKHIAATWEKLFPQDFSPNVTMVALEAEPVARPDADTFDIRDLQKPTDAPFVPIHHRLVDDPFRSDDTDEPTAPQTETGRKEPSPYVPATPCVPRTGGAMSKPAVMQARRENLARTGFRSILQLLEDALEEPSRKKSDAMIEAARDFALSRLADLGE